MQFICNQCDVRMLSQGAQNPGKGYMEIKFLCPTCKNICKFLANPGEVGLIKAFNNWERGEALFKTIYNLVTENLSHEIDQVIPENKSMQPDIFEDLNWQYEKSNWIVIHPGSFVFNTRFRGEYSHDYNEDMKRKLKAREITIDKGFNIGKFPVTQIQWSHVMEGKALNTKLNHNDPKSRTPMVNISWDDCQEFIKTLNSFSENNQFRLPTEMEWEYACKSGTKSSWSFGENRNDVPKFAWYIDSNSSTNNQTPIEVGLKPPNPWGIYDMLGNVFEWCQDLYGTKNSNDKINQKDLLDPDIKTTTTRIVRGGYFRYFPGSTSSDSRSARLSTDRQPSIGLRLVKTL